MRRGSRVGSRVGGMDGGLIGVDVDGDGVTDFTLPATPSMDPDHEPFALVDLFMSPHRPLVPVWVNNVVSITVYAGALALFFLVLLQTGSETYRETEISQHVMTGGGPGSRTGKRDVECRCLSKLTASLDLEDPVLADGGSWRVVSDIALPSAANCERQFADLPVEDAHVVAYDGARGDAYGFCYSAAANRTWAPLARTAAGPCRDALDGTTPSADVSNMIVVKMRVCPQGGRRLQPGSGNGPTGQGQGQGQGQGPGPGPRAGGRRKGPWARAQGPGPGPFAKLLNEFVSQRSYFLLASLNYLMNLFPRRSYFLLADFIDILKSTVEFETPRWNWKRPEPKGPFRKARFQASQKAATFKARIHIICHKATHCKLL